MKTETLEKENRTLLTDLYQITMCAAYFDNQKNDQATFELFVRKLPKDWGFFIANGIEDAVDYATNLHFGNEEREFLKSQGMFNRNFLEYLEEFRFTGEIYAVREGTPVTANTPLLRITASRMEAQFLETMLLNTVNFQTMIATKAQRVVQAAAPAAVIDFGLRRAQEHDAGMKGARAAYLAGAVATSNVKAGKEYGIPIAGTHAHSFVMSFPSELDAFRAYVKTFPANATLLIDTYDTCQGAKNAAIVAKELEVKGKNLGAVRLDSGDLAELSKQVRNILDSAGLSYVKIVASNDLNEYKITELRNKGAKIEGYGVGTELITAKPVAAISGVYKLVEDEDGAKIKLSEEKKSYPGRKQVYRKEENGQFIHDVLALENEDVEGIPLLEKVVENGERITARRNLREIRTYCREEVTKMPVFTRNITATPYELKESKGLQNLVIHLSKQYGEEK